MEKKAAMDAGDSNSETGISLESQRENRDKLAIDTTFSDSCNKNDYAEQLKIAGDCFKDNKTNNDSLKMSHDIKKNNCTSNDGANAKGEVGEVHEQTEPVPTDEFGRELSAYEIMRLERIRRNQEKLAELGLERTLKMPTEERKKKTRKRPFHHETHETSLRRQTISRRSKIKGVNYSDDVNLLKPFNKVNITKPTRKKNTNQTVPLFIYKEMKQVTSNRRHALKTAEKYHRFAEVEYRYAKRQADIFIRKEKRRQTAEKNKVILPLLQEVESRQWDISMARNMISSEITKKDAKIGKMEEEVKAAEVRFPQSIKETERSLDFLLHERLFSFLKKKNVEFSPERKVKRKSKTVEIEKHKLNTNTNPIAEVFSLHFDDLQSRVQEKAKKTKKPSPKQVGGPISPKFSLSLQRKWLEGDDPVAPSVSTHFVPQVGDTILYYPYAHREYLDEYPDIRCQKKNLLFRRPLWQRARDEIESVKVGSDGKKEQSSAFEKKWWTQEWLSCIHDSAGCYPIVCRVEKTMCEFPYDKEAEEEAKNQKYNKKIMQAERVDEKLMNKVDASFNEFKRRSSQRIKPQLGLSVTLRPLTPIIPSYRSKSMNHDGNLFQEELLSPPPLFSVLIFPSEKAQFLIPFVWAYRLSLSLSNGDNVKIPGGQLGTVISLNGKQEGCITDSTIESFGDVIPKDAKADFYNSHEIDKFISNSYTTKSYPLPEADLRAAVQVILFQHYKRQTARKGTKASLSHESDSPSTPKGLPISGRRKSGKKAKSVSNLIEWIRMTLPCWNGVKVLLEHDGIEFETSAWNLIDTGTKFKNDNGQNDALVAALAPSVLMSPSTSNNGGLIYNINEKLRNQIEARIKVFIDANAEATALFISPVTEKVAPFYSCCVPISMCFRKILNRLKIRQMKYLNQKNNTDDPTEQQATEDAHCCYYRSTGAILSDLSAMYNNCLLYNDPESAIVLQAEEVTNNVKIIIEKVESRWIRQTKLIAKEERKAARNAELVARGKEGLKSLPHPSYSATIDAEGRCTFYYGELSCDWIQETRHHEELQLFASPLDNNFTSRYHWSPQCGDKVIYNRQMHGKFVNAHFASLAKAQRILPQVLPKTSRKKGTNTNKEILRTNKGSKPSSDLYWMLGTVEWVRAVFPSLPEEQTELDTETFDVPAPLLAVGIQFHYNWLPDIHIVYWRPCEVNAKGDESNNTNCVRVGENAKAVEQHSVQTNNIYPNALDQEHKPFFQERICNSCSLPLNFSFIRPAWKVKNEKLLPPFPMSLSRVDQPSGLPDQVIIAVDNCFKILKQRCIENVSIDHFESKIAFDSLFDTQFDELLPHLQHIFSDSEDEAELPSDDITGEMSLDALSHVHFLPRWCQDRKERDVSGIASRTRISLATKVSVRTKNDDNVNPLHETILPFPNLCLDLIHKRVRNGFYRNRLAIAHDIREAFHSAILYLLMEREKVRYINETSIRRIIQEFDHTCSGAKEPKNSLYLSKKENTILQRIIRIRKLHAVALISVLETPTAEIAFALKQDLAKDDYVSNERRRAKRQADSIISSLSPVSCSFRRPLSKTEPLPSLKVKVELGNTISESDANTTNLVENCEEDTEYINWSKPIILEPNDYEGNVQLIKATLCMPNATQTCARCRLLKYSSLLTCRIRKAHSNVDFHPWLDYLKEIGGVNGLLKLLIPSYVPPISNTTFEITPEVPAVGLNKKTPELDVVVLNPTRKVVTATNLTSEKCKSIEHYDDLSGRAPIEKSPENNSERNSINETCINKIDHTSLEETNISAFTRGNTSTKTVTTLLQENPQKKVLVEETPKKSAQATLERTNTSVTIFKMGNAFNKTATISLRDYSQQKQIVQKTPKKSNQTELEDTKTSIKILSMCSASTKTAKTLVGDHAQQEQVVEDTTQNPCELLKKAELALKLARETLASAEEKANTKRLLSDEFIRAFFVVDPTDGHYEICPICGLGGDVLCCETCPTVSHPKCVGLTAIPSGDWHCTDCSRNLDQNGGQYSSNKQNWHTGNTTHNTPPYEREKSNEVNGVTLKDLLDELKSKRLKEKGDECKNIRSINRKGEARLTVPYEANKLGNKTKGVVKLENAEDFTETEKKTVALEEKNMWSKNGSVNFENSVAEFPRTAQGVIPIEIGTKIGKQFDQGFFTGTIISLPSLTSEFYKVEYDDGDNEDLSEDEVKGLINLYNEHQSMKSVVYRTFDTNNNDNDSMMNGAFSAMNNGKRRRGRPRKKLLHEKGRVAIIHDTFSGSVVDGRRKGKKRGRPRKVALCNSLEAVTDNTDSRINSASSSVIVNGSTRKNRGRPPNSGTPKRKRGRPRKYPR